MRGGRGHCGKGHANVPTIKPHIHRRHCSDCNTWKCFQRIMTCKQFYSDHAHCDLCDPYLGPVKGHPGKDGLGDACPLQLLPHTVVDLNWHIRRPHRRPSWRLALQPGCGASPLAAVCLLRGLGIRGFGEDLGRSTTYRRVVEILLWGGWETLTSQHTANSILLIEKLGHHKLLVDHLGAQRLAYQPMRAQAERGTATYVGNFRMREKKGGALISWAACDWLLGEGDMCGLVGEAVNLWCRNRKETNNC